MQLFAVPQVRSRTRQLRREGANGPSCASLADPPKLMTSPTRQLVDCAGLVIVAIGAVLPTLMTFVATDEAPRLSVTLTETVTGPTTV